MDQQFWIANLVLQKQALAGYLVFLSQEGHCRELRESPLWCQSLDQHISRPWVRVQSGQLVSSSRLSVIFGWRAIDCGSIDWHLAHVMARFDFRRLRRTFILADCIFSVTPLPFWKQISAKLLFSVWPRKVDVLIYVYWPRSESSALRLRRCRANLGTTSVTHSAHLNSQDFPNRFFFDMKTAS